MGAIQAQRGVGVPDTRNWGEIARAGRAFVFGGYGGPAFYDFVLGIAAPVFARGYQKLRAHPNFRAILAERPDLLSVLSDDDYLASLPPGSLGHAYRSFLQTNRLDAGVFNLESVIRPIAERRGWDDDFFYAIVRSTALHDMHHVLGNYGPDMFGELGALGLHCGQLEPAGSMKATTIAVFTVVPGASPAAKLRFFREAVRRGQCADHLLAAPYERLLDRPLEEVRELLGVQPSHRAHPGGHLFTSWTPPGIPPVTRWDYDAIMRAA